MVKISSKLLNSFKDFAPGPLDFYRSKASFDWKELKVLLETEDIIIFQNELYKALQKHPDYNVSSSLSMDFDELRRLTARQSLAYKSIDLLSLESTLSNFKRPSAATRIMMQFAPSSTIKYSISNRLFVAAILNMGTNRHLQYVTDTEDGKIFGCYCLTEIGHGSNAKGMRTTASYDSARKSFILNSPDFEAAKCWAGGLGQGATHAIVYAQLILNNTSYGLHAFIVPIRNPQSLLPHNGLEIGDMGEKIGLNGIDNGFVAFHNYEIPRENLLNKLGDVSESGEYITSIKDPNKRHGAALGSLSGGRVNITCICEAMGIKALTIAIRYSAVRKQFGPDEKELPILEYQTHQFRLLPYLAAAYVLKVFNTYFTEVHFQFLLDSMTSNKENLPDLGIEIHAISSACKPMAGWIMKDAIQQCRETCGGHGYLKASGIGDIRNDHDANLTYEGENYVLIQQTSNWLLKMWPLVANKQTITTPLKSVDFLSNGLEILTNKKFTARNVEEMCNPTYIIEIYQWLVCYLLKRTSAKIDSQIDSGENAFTAKNNCQIYYAQSLAVAYIQHFFLQRMLIFISEIDQPDVKNVLTNLLNLYGLWSLERHIPTLYQGELLRGPVGPTLIQDSILKLCGDLKNDAVALIDAVAPPDFILDSVLGASDGMVYKHLEEAMYRSPYFKSRPRWWQEIINLHHKGKL